MVIDILTTIFGWIYIFFVPYLVIGLVIFAITWFIILSLSGKKTRLRTMLSIAGALLVLVILGYFINDHFKIKGSIGLAMMNNNLQAGEVKLNMTEKKVISLYGSGEYIEGFGGHVRNFDEKGFRVGISGDEDNDFYGNVRLIEFTNKESSVFGIKIGDSLQDAFDKVKQYGFHAFEPGLFMNGEFGIAIRGKTTVDSIQIWFEDKDLKDRQY